jgi:hypothetical protein
MVKGLHVNRAQQGLVRGASQCCGTAGAGHHAARLRGGDARHAGIPEAIDEGVQAFLVEERDAEGFCQAIGRALSL